MNILKKYFIGLGAILLFFSFVTINTFAESATVKTLTDTTLNIFTSDSCDFCDDLKKDLKKEYGSEGYTFKNIDSSESNKKDFQTALVTCGKAKGTVPMFLHNGTCVTGKEQIVNTFKDIKSAKEIESSTSAEVKKTSIITGALEDLGDVKFSDEITVSDYAVTAFLLLVLFAGLFVFLKQRGSTNKRIKLLSTLAFFIPMACLAVFLLVKVNSLNTLSATGADAAKKSKNCLATNSCKDWNEFVKAKSENAKNEGRHSDAKEWDNRVVDQSILNAQIADANNALMTAISKDPKGYCGDYGEDGTCTYAEFLRNTQDFAKSAVRGSTACTDPNSAACKTAEANAYLNKMYGSNAATGEKFVGTTVGGDYQKAIEDYKAIKLKEALDGLVGKLDDMSATQRRDIYAELTKICNCTIPTNLEAQKELFNIYSAQLGNVLFKFIPTDTFTGMGIYVPNVAIYDPAQSDECEVPTSGGACPVGTATCICQKEPFRATCAAIGQNCDAVCRATHNVCENCSKRTITKEDTETTTTTTEQPICQQACSATSPCSDGTSCVSGKCVNPSCTEETDCLCGTSTTPICGDGIINESPQSPEQCELGNPAGTSCDWNSCNKNTCKCPDSNPNWDITKSASVVCINTNTSNVYAQVKYNISATYINADSPATVGTLERVVDKPENYMNTWLDTASITNGGAHTNAGGLVDKITWDLSGELSKFTIPSGQTEVSKSNFLSYTFKVPKEFFGRYVNLVTGYPNQSTDDNSFNHTNSIYIACNVPSTAGINVDLIKGLIGVFLLASGLVFATSQKGSKLVNSIVESPVAEGFSLLFASRTKREHLKKITFEDKVLQRARK